MAGVNKVILVGNLGADPEVRYTPGGTAVANFRIATTESYKNKEGTKEEKTEWHRIVTFGKLAEICGEYLHKGKQVYLEGRIQTSQWDDKEGNKRYTTEIVCNQMQMLGRVGDKGSVPAGAPEEAGEPAGGTKEDTADFDDVPF